MRKGCPWALAHIGHSLFAFIGRQTVCGRCEALYACRLDTSRGTQSVPQKANSHRKGVSGLCHFFRTTSAPSKNGAAPALCWPPVDTLYNHNTLYNQLICQRIFSSNTLTKYSSMLMIVAWKGRASAHNGGGATPFFILYIWLPFLVLPRRLS